MNSNAEATNIDIGERIIQNLIISGPVTSMSPPKWQASRVRHLSKIMD